MRRISFTIIIAYILLGCNKNTQAILKVEKEYNFGEIKKNEKIIHNFKIENKSDVELKIEKIGTSCGCTVASIKDSIINKNESTEVKVIFTPSETDKGKISKSIVILANTEPPYTSITLKGIIK